MMSHWCLFIKTLGHLVVRLRSLQGIWNFCTVIWIKPKNCLRNVPEDSFLKEFSSSKKRKKQKHICEVCGIVYDSGRDKEYGNPWIGCDKEGFDVWQHLGYIWLQMLRSIKALTWKCGLHRATKNSNHYKKGKKCWK